MSKHCNELVFGHVGMLRRKMSSMELRFMVRNDHALPILVNLNTL